ncbi:MAG: hypothetical protein LBR14_04855 [Clostridiales Family XIII bacterium]|nr:hypothetical protein [Clostridiales Family XIII bacterium]
MGALDIAAIVVSLAAVFIAFYEGRNVRRSFQEQTYQEFVATWFELDKFFIDDPELRKYFYENYPLEESDPKYGKVLSVAEYFDDAFTYANSQSGIIPPNLRASYKNYQDRIEHMHAFQVYRQHYGDFVNTWRIDKPVS